VTVSDPTYYTVAEAAYFPGTAALLNSLRLTGNVGELVVLDQGFTDGQRARLAQYAKLVDVRDEQVAHPSGLKSFAAKLDPSGIVVLIDSDMVVTRSLDPFLEHASVGRICLFADPPVTRNRWFAEWAEVLDLRAPLRRQVYMNAGFVALSVESWPGLLARWHDLCRRIPAEQVFADDVSQPFWAGDQDVLNALLASEIPPDAVAVLPENAVADRDRLGRVRIEDSRTLECSLEGQPLTILHHSLGRKAWQPDAWLRLRDGAYIRLLPRLLFGDDVTLALGRGEVPFWVRPGRAARVFIRGIDTLQRPAQATVRALPKAARDRLIATLARASNRASERGARSALP
jgi:hypothetical protein